MSRYFFSSAESEAKFAKERCGVLTSTPTLQRRGSGLTTTCRVEWRIFPNDHFECRANTDDRGTGSSVFNVTRFPVACKKGLSCFTGTFNVVVAICLTMSTFKVM